MGKLKYEFAILVGKFAMFAAIAAIYGKSDCFFILGEPPIPEELLAKKFKNI